MYMHVHNMKRGSEKYVQAPEGPRAAQLDTNCIYRYIYIYRDLDIYIYNIMYVFI